MDTLCSLGLSMYSLVSLNPVSLSRLLRIAHATFHPPQFVFSADGFDIALGSFTGQWISSTQYLLTLAQTAPTNPTVGISSILVRCRVGNGITLAPLGSSRECNSSRNVPLSGDFGALPPRISSALASDPDDGDAVFGPGISLRKCACVLSWSSHRYSPSRSGDVLDITFSAQTNQAGYTQADVLNKSEVNPPSLFLSARAFRFA